MNLNKQRVIEETLKTLEDDLSSKKKHYKELQDSVIKADGAMQSRSDTYKFQYSQQAENVLKMIESVEKLITFLKELEIDVKDREVIKVGDVVIVDKNGVEQVYLLAPDYGVMRKIDVGGREVYMVSEKSPIGELLIKSKLGQDVEFRGQVLKIKNILLL